MTEPPAVVVADSGVLIVLAKVDRLGLLQSLYSRIVVPDVVWREVVGDGDRDGAALIEQQPWIEVSRADPTLARAHESLVDAGEAAAIAIAQHTPNTLLLIDDARGRKLALRLGIAIKGTLGVLVLAKRRGLLENVRPALEQLAAGGPLRVARVDRRHVACCRRRRVIGRSSGRALGAVHRATRRAIHPQ